MCKKDAIKACLKFKHNSSALGLDGIGYIHLKFGGDPTIKFISKMLVDLCDQGRNITVFTQSADLAHE
jgi:hypothetical protein